MPPPSTAARVTIAITPGEPAGIGPDLCLALAARGLVPAGIGLVAIADPQMLRERARALDVDVRLVPWQRGAQPATAGALSVHAVTCHAPVVCGTPDPANARYVLGTLEHAVSGCLDGEFDALVTGPVHKAVINRAGIPFTGHTEWLAERTGAPLAVMMLATPGLRVALVTTHLPLQQVPAAITRERIEATLRIAATALRERFGITAPRIVVCGLNPHAGEGGELGAEDDAVVRPALERLRAEGLDIDGPRPADSAFLPPLLARTDLVVAMYHDQGLPVLKHAGFGEAVNVTLGLPIVRTSVDHGTALELAGSGTADPGSLVYALRVAADMVAQGVSA